MASLATPIVSGEFSAERRMIESQLSKVLHRDSTPYGGAVYDAMRYAVYSGGQRIRPLLALRIARLLGRESSHVLVAAAAVELIHCASLIVDDLPCMDDSSFRRDRPSVHVAYNESTAILAAFALVALAARSCIAVPPSTPSRMIEFQRNLLGTLDVSSLIAGQAFDLELAGTGSRARAAEQNRIAAAALKTAPLFQLAVRAGMTAGKTAPFTQALLVDFGFHFGVAFQLADDVEDGDGEAFRAFDDAVERARQCLKAFGVRAIPVEELIGQLHAKTCTKDCCHR